MGKSPIPDSVKAHMATGEKALWWHVSETPMALGSFYEQAAEEPLWGKALRWTAIVICLLLLLPQREAITGNPKLAIALGLGGFFVSWILFRTKFGSQTAEAFAPHSIFQNLVMTDRQLIAFNSPKKAFPVSRNDITSVETDFENGGPALRIKAATFKRDIVIIGNANFNTAKHQYYATR